MHAVVRVSARFLLSFACLLLAPLSHSQSFSATWARGTLALTIPCHAPHAGAGRLEVELLDPGDKVLAEAERRADAPAGDVAWNQDLTVPSSLSFDDLVWERVRWRFWYDGDTAPALEQVSSVSTILRRPVLHILAQNAYLAGTQAAVRLVVSDASADADESPVIDSGSVRVELLVPHAAPRVLYAGHLDRRGTAEADFRFPAGLTGSYDLRFTAMTPIGSAETTENVQLEDKLSVLLTTEKPIYQPSQTIHVRALALDRASSHAAAGRRLTFEMEDAHGNKVFRKAATTDAFGVASAEFTLADEVNLGAWHLRALLGDSAAPVTAAELTLTVERYVLPKFRVAIDLPLQNGKPKRDYRPGDHVTGTVHANYFFGKPVDHASITVKATGLDVAEFQAASADGQTDAAGDYHFDLRLPDYFAGSGLAQGAAPVVVEATVKDAASHSETHDEPITVTRSPLLILAVPESGQLVPGIENQVYVLTSYPDGSPAQTDLRVRGEGMPDTKTSAGADGIAVVQLKPTGDHETLRIDADDRHGNRASASLPLESRAGDDQLLLRAGRAVYKPGERMDLSVYSTRQRGAAYIDLIRDGQTILTRDVDLVNGHADLSVPLTPTMAGTLSVDAYIFGSNAAVVSDHRLIFVQPADDLHIEATADAASYLPGSEAQVHFRVTNARGQGVAAALGLEIVDEAVFALAEKQPGFAKVFFYLEQELMKPRYEIHSLSRESIVAPAEGDDAQQNRDAGVLFSAAEAVDPHTFDTEAGKSLPNESPDLLEQYRNAFVDYVESLASKLNSGDRKNDDLQRRFAALVDDRGRKPQDAWGTELRLEPTGWSRRHEQYYRVLSAGPDRQFGTGDDLTVFLETRTGSVVSSARGGSITLRMEHDRGPMNGLAEIAGTVNDQSGAVIPGARITVRSANGETRHAVANAPGSFSVPALPAGQYTVSIESAGFTIASRQVALAPRDRAVLTAVLEVGAAMETVEVAADNVALEPRRFEMGQRARGAVALEAPIPAPMAAGPMINGMLMDRRAISGLDSGLSAAKTPQEAEAAAEPHIRSYFPEALYINPEILTDGNGAATVTIPLADSITTWRMAMFASTAGGALGNASSSLKVFQDFFVDLDLPVTLTQGDRVSIPVAVYNYSGHRGDVTLSLQPADWFTLADDTAEKTISVDAGQVGGAQFTIAVQHIGKFKLTLGARMHGGAERQDEVVREIEVVPNGQQHDIVFNGRLDSTVQHSFHFPQNAIPGAEKLYVRLYPGPLSQVVEGMDGILQMPFGCFEQTSSVTYPNVLALDYMKRNNRLTPEVRAKAEGYISTGYQRLLTFEVPGGGFSWFGEAPANKILTAYGLMEFHDMAQVYDVDPRLITRTAQWLAAQQQGDGSWKPDTQFINEGATNRYNSDLLRITAYIAWALESADAEGPAVARARDYIAGHLDAKADAYTLAVVANFAAGNDKDSDLAHRALQMLIDAHTEEGEMAYWKSEETGVYGGGQSAAVETTGLAVQALLRTGQDPELARKALAWLLSKKGADGNWGTTQATIMALRALVLASDRAAGDAHGDVTLMLNGKTVDTLTVTADNNDLLHQFVLPVPDPDAEQNIEIRFSGTGGMAYQIVGRSFVPWPAASQHEALTIDVAYDRTKLAQNDIVTATATIHSNLHATANMVMVDLGIPPGFDLLSEDLQDLVEKTAGANSGRLEKFSLTATQAILYFDSIGPNQTVKLPFRLRAKYPMRARTFESRVYEYYNPQVSAVAAPVPFEVTGK
jgi:A-macroglobulin TED domain/Alpha-2-macroglobulin family/Carboxypeptidase regulatory-like domain/A-macroglobulin receptor binding domain/MG2 domain